MAVYENKSQGMVDALSSLFPDFVANAKAGKCATCGGEVGEFRDALSRKEYSISGCCQKCQDNIFGSGE